MKEFVLFFRWSSDSQPAPEKMKVALTQWQEWINGIVADGKLANPGSPLDFDGKVVRAKNVITKGAYTENNESLGGYIVIKAKGYDEAVEIAKGCPILSGFGNVEVRKVVSFSQ